MLLSVRGDNFGRMYKTKAKIEEEWSDACGGEVERSGVVYGWLVEWRQSVLMINVCFMFSNNVCPVVGVREGVIWPRWGFVWLGLAFGCELVGVDVKEFEVEMEKWVHNRWCRRCTFRGDIEAEEECISVCEKGDCEAALWR